MGSDSGGAQTVEGAISPERSLVLLDGSDELGLSSPFLHPCLMWLLGRPELLLNEDGTIPPPSAPELACSPPHTTRSLCEACACQGFSSVGLVGTCPLVVLRTAARVDWFSPCRFSVCRGAVCGGGAGSGEGPPRVMETAPRESGRICQVTSGRSEVHVSPFISLEADSLFAGSWSVEYFSWSLSPCEFGCQTE